MTLDEAIEHAEEKAKTLCGECAQEHLQLADWLKELKSIRADYDTLFYKLVGVMHFVDKWLEGDELMLDEVQRADLAREKALQAIEKLEMNLEELRGEIKR